jgi:hypothetical protein
MYAINYDGLNRPVLKFISNLRPKYSNYLSIYTYMAENIVYTTQIFVYWFWSNIYLF